MKRIDKGCWEYRGFHIYGSPFRRQVHVYFGVDFLKERGSLSEAKKFIDEISANHETLPAVLP